VRQLYEERRGGYKLSDVRVAVRADDPPVRVLRRVTHRIIEELDLRPPKAKAWEDKRQRMRQMWVRPARLCRCVSGQGGRGVIRGCAHTSTHPQDSRRTMRTPDTHNTHAYACQHTGGR
jgi:hypothetical protein